MRTGTSVGSTGPSGPNGRHPMAPQSIKSRRSLIRSKIIPTAAVILCVPGTQRNQTYGASPLPRALSVLRRQWRAQLSTLPTQCRHIFGVPFNIASYALLTRMVAQVCGLKAKEFIHTFGDLHLYANHVEQAKEQLSRSPRPRPQMEINPQVDQIDGFTIDDFKLVNYDPHPSIRAPIAV